MKLDTNISGSVDKRETGRFFGAMLRRNSLLAFTALLVTGCVAQDPVLSLNSSPQTLSSQPELETPSGVLVPGSDVAALSASTQGPWPNNVPQPAPRANSTNASEVQTAALAVAEPSAAPIPAQRVIQTATNNDPANGTGNVNLLQDVNTQPVTADTNLQGSLSTQPVSKPKPAGLLARLFQSNNTAPRETAPQRKRVTISRERGDDGRRIALAHAGTSKKTTRTGKSIREQINRQQQGSLPGVKSNSQLFGIRPNSETGGADAPETRLAAVGSLGLISPNGLRVQHDKVQVSCLKPDILRILKVVERHYGKKPIITSGYRSPKRNRRAGGVKNSMHIFCKAVDIQVEGVSKWDLAKYLRTIPGRGGVGTYCRTKSVHIDTGSVREWHHPCRRSSKRKKRSA